MEGKEGKEGDKQQVKNKDSWGLGVGFQEGAPEWRIKSNTNMEPVATQSCMGASMAFYVKVLVPRPPSFPHSWGCG